MKKGLLPLLIAAASMGNHQQYSLQDGRKNRMATSTIKPAERKQRTAKKKAAKKARKRNK